MSLITFRKELHQHPELSGAEIRTSERILNFLKGHPPDRLIEGVGGYSLLAGYRGKEEGKTLVLRCELDALPIQEVNSFEHRSISDGVSHKCGHDGHMVILCAVAEHLSSKRPDQGWVWLLFQSAEENGKGAEAVLADEVFTDLKPDRIVALHNIPGAPLNQVICKPGSFTCSVHSMIVEFQGKTAHAGEPEKGINPALAVSELISEYHQLNQTDLNREDYRQLTPVHVSMGELAYGISAGEAEVHFTYRTRNDAHLENLEERMEAVARSIADKHGLGVSFSYTERFHANENHPVVHEWIRQAAGNLGLRFKEPDLPFRFGEDFGLFTQIYEGGMFGLGAGESTPALHNPDYDFPDELIDTGKNVFLQLIQSYLNA